MPYENTAFLDFDLPWPNKRLSPNARVHWSVLAAAKSDYKKAAQLIAAGELVNTGLPQKPDLSRAHIQLIFCPPKNFAYDLDNALARMKAGIDGIARAFGCDDKGWTFAIERGEVHRPKGRVQIRVFLPAELAQTPTLKTPTLRMSAHAWGAQ